MGVYETSWTSAEVHIKSSCHVEHIVFISRRLRLSGVLIPVLLFLLPMPSIAGWSLLRNGLEWGEFISPIPAENGDSVIRVLRIDLDRYGLKLINASALKDGHPMSAREWGKKFNLEAAINASMYQKDLRTSVSLMRTQGHVNNPRLSRDKAILAFDPVQANDPKVRIIDRQCDSFRQIKKRYRTLIQSIRMISCRGINVWQPSEKRWSTAALALDHEGRMLFIHVKSSYSTYDLINILQALPLSIDRAMYLEGGPQAQIFVRNGKSDLEFFGSYSEGLVDAAPPRYAHPIPNIIGIYRKP